MLGRINQNTRPSNYQLH